jgi:uncharacterized membrane protein
VQGFTLGFIAVGLVFIGLALPMIRRRVKPNPIYGLRVPATFADEWVWYEANARSGGDLVILGVVTVVLGLVPVLAPGLDEATYALVSAGILTAGALLCAVIGWRRANRLLRERRGIAGV